MANNKLQNIKAIQQMLDGEHRFQTKKTVGFSDTESEREKSKQRLIGEVWEETDPVTGIVTVIEQRDGFRIKKSKNTDVLQGVRDYIRSFPNCQKETCTCVQPNHLDEKMRKLNGMCFDCTIEFEHKLKISGEFNEYAQQKIKNNAIAWLAQAEQEVELLKQVYTETSKVVTNADGLTETIHAKMTPAEFEEQIQLQFNKFKEDFLRKLNGETNEKDMEVDK
jgi:hypothetical protein